MSIHTKQLLVLLLTSATGFADITDVSPNMAAQGAADLSIQFTLAEPPPLPPEQVAITSVTIGSISAKSFQRSGATVTAVFDIPADETPGTKTCTVMFPGPSYTAVNGFTVTAGADSPPVITRQPTSQIVSPNGTPVFSLTASGATPLTYQWQKDAGDLSGATATTLTISSASESDEGVYRCIVSNAFGVVTSEVAVLTVSDAPPYPGYNLFAPIASTDTYLMDNNGTIVHTWTSSYRPGQSCYLLEDGSLLRTANTQDTTFNVGGTGGRVERFDWDGNLAWAFDYSTTQVRHHHDVEALPNGNILLVAWELKTEAEAIAAGRNPSRITDGELWADHVIEVAPTGSYGGTIVWEWHSWDHLAQDYDAAKANYGVVGDHPELIDINTFQTPGADWHHINAIDYNAELDQIMVSVRNFSAIWIIDHSTTTAEAAGHTGGGTGVGGDLLYRWGNPQNYDAGTVGDQQLFVQHDAEWIANGLPGAGNILIFNNGQGRPDGDSSSIDEIVPPLAPDGTYSNSSAFGPATPAWSYAASPATNFYATRISGSQRLPNGHTLVCDGPTGHFFEVTTNGQTVWEYDHDGEVFRVERYGTDYAGFDGTDLDDAWTGPTGGYPIVDTGQIGFYDDATEISEPGTNDAFYGQDGCYDGNQPAYVISPDGLTVYDYNTGLTWTRSHDWSGDGVLDVNDKMTQADAVTYAATLNAANYGGYPDWRLPSIKELYSLMDFRGTDPNVAATDSSGLRPFIDTNYFDIGYGDVDAGERIIDSQFATTTIYVDYVMNNQQALFGLNLVDGRIKGYPLTGKTYYVYYCRGNSAYGINGFGSNGDGTVTDHATGLMWAQADSGVGMDWGDALTHAESSELAGHTDWRLPNTKELQSLVDYTRSPDTTASAAIDPLFSATQITNMTGNPDYPWYWSGTTHLKFTGSAGDGSYVCFGRGLGSMDGSTIIDVHGAGCQRSDPKTGDPADYPSAGHGPQGDVQRVFNYVRLVRDADADVHPGTDSDGDGLTDWEESNTYGTNPTLADSDNDGMNDGDEITAGTSPTSDTSVLALVDVAEVPASAGIALRWLSVSSRTYTISASTDLLANVWQRVQSGIPATPPLNVHTTAQASAAHRFYRISVR